MPIERDLAGAAAFIICGGPSVEGQNLDLLRGHYVVAVNRSFETVPWADALFFADSRCWTWYKNGIDSFAGRVITVYDSKPLQKYPARFEQYLKTRPPTLSRDPECLTLARTSVTGAINYLAQRGCSLLVTLGLDGKAGKGADGKPKTHHHAPHPKPASLGCWEKHRKELNSILPSLRALGVEVLNASPDSACDAFPIVTLDEALARAQMRAAA